MARTRQRWHSSFRSLGALGLCLAFGCGSRGQILEQGGELEEWGGTGPGISGGQAGNTAITQGGSSSGGTHHGGASAGGASFGGAHSGGASQGGAQSGGASSGGAQAGGAPSGGVAGFSFGSGGTTPGLSCVLNGALYPDGSTGIPAPDGCNTCDCRMGQLLCSNLMCVPSSCIVNGQVYASGSVMPDPASCNSCVCDNGAVGGCTELFCPLPAPCQIGRAYYQDGYGFVTSDGSTSCTCHAGKMACVEIP